jgi:alpha-glucosidase
MRGTIYGEGRQPWWKAATVYQVYPRSFCDTDGDGVGDLRGVARRLDHLAWLGVDAIWLSPFYRSPMADLGYDVADYTDVDPMFGTLADFDRLLAESHRRGIRVLVDWVPNHSSDRHPWFIDARGSRASRRRDWYVWRDPAAGGGPPNDWLSAFPRYGPSWTWDPPTGQYYLHSFLPQQPDLNWANPEVVAAMHATLRFWLDRGVDGFRIDAIPELGKGVLPRSGERPTEARPANWPDIHDLLRGVRKVVDEYDDRVIVGEVTVLDQRQVVGYVNQGDGLHLVHNFNLLHQPWDPGRFRDTVDVFETLVAPYAWPCWLLNNHDNPRAASRYAGDGRGARRARVAALVLLTLRGTAFLYQGEELGLEDVPVPREATVDVNGRDPQRTPIPWAPPSQVGAGAGFTSGGRPWLPLTDRAEEVNVATQVLDPSSILLLYRRILEARDHHGALRSGSYEPVETDEAVFGYLRRLGGERLLVLCNFGDHPVRPLRPATAPANAARCLLLLSTAEHREPGEVDLDALRLQPEEGVLLRLPPEGAG